MCYIGFKHRSMAKKKSKYEIELEKLARKSKRIVFTDEENIKIMEELNEGMPEFLRDQKRRDGEAALEFKTVILD